MKLILTPQSNPAHTVQYSAEGDILTVVMGDKIDTFDFTDVGDGEISVFSSDVLPFCPVSSATISRGEITVVAVSLYGYHPVKGDDEADSAFQSRLDEWEHAQTEQEVTL